MASSFSNKIKPLLAILASVYTIQSLIGMFTLQGLPAVMRSEGISTSQIGLFYLAMLPWGLKFLWSPYIERQRKQGSVFVRHAVIIILAQFCMVAMLVLLSLTSAVSHLNAVFACVLVLTLASTFADITADGLAVDQLPVKKRYLGNIMQVGGAYCGAVFGGGLFIYVMGFVSWQYALLILAALVLVMSLPTWSLFRMKEVSLSANVEDAKPSLSKSLQNPLVRTGLVLVIVSQLGTRGALSMMMPFLYDQGLSLANLGLLVAGGGVLTGLVGVAFGGWLVKQVSAIKAIYLLLVVEAITFSLLALYSAQVFTLDWGLEALFILNSVVSAAKFVALYTLMMDYAYGTQSGVDFSMFQSMDMLVAIATAMICGVIIERFGYLYHYGFLVTFTCIAMACINKLIGSTQDTVEAQ